MCVCVYMHIHTNMLYIIYTMLYLCNYIYQLIYVYDVLSRFSCV